MGQAAELTPFRLSNMRQAARCLARTRRGTPCQCPAMKGRRRCRIHGGAEGSGGPKGERNGEIGGSLTWKRALAAGALVGFGAGIAQAQAKGGDGSVTPPVLISGSSTVTADTVLTPEQEKALLNAEDEILQAGPLPLDLLEQRVDAWIGAQNAGR